MNKHGQVLILFIIILPLILALMALVVDLGLMMNNHNKLEQVTTMIIKDSLKDNLSENEILSLFKENNISTTNIKINQTPYELNIKNEITIESIFGKIIGLKHYQIKIDLTGSIKNEKILIE